MEGHLWEHRFKKRVSCMVCISMFLAIVVICRVVSLQLSASHSLQESADAVSYRFRDASIYTGKYSDDAYAQQYRHRDIYKVRGQIRDRNGKVLACGSLRHNLNCHPNQITQKQRLADKLFSTLALDEKEKQRILKDLASDQSFVCIKERLPDNERNELISWNRKYLQSQDRLSRYGLLADREFHAPLEGVELDDEVIGVRVYPNGRLASQLVGYTNYFCMPGEDSSTGTEGIEAQYDYYLSGRKGKVFEAVDEGANPVAKKSLVVEEPVPGMHVELTIDSTVQYYTEKILKKYVNGVYKTRDASGNSIVQKAEGGICMVMDARTGEILASAVAPDYTPGPDTGADKKGLQRNRAFCDAFEPGSILKVFTAAAALKYGATPNSTYYTENTLMVDGWPINNSHSIASGYWTISDIIIESLNTGTAAIALDLGREKLSKTLHEFGFGEFSGVVNKNSHVACERNGQIVSGEETGAFGFWNWKDWSKCDTCVISFGQAATVTPIQICSAMQAVANGGRRMQPRIVKRVVDDDGNVKLDYPIVEKNRPISEEAAAGLTDMLIKVVSEGTGQAAAVPGYQVAGKTGTAQVVDSERGGYKEGCYNAAFVGYVPARNPRIVVLVKMENPSPDIYGGSVCGPIFKEICQHVLPYLGCLPDDAK